MKKLIIILSIIAVIFIAGKIAYNVFAPKILDKLIEKNIGKLLADTDIPAPDDVETLLPSPSASPSSNTGDTQGNEQSSSESNSASPEKTTAKQSEKKPAKTYTEADYTKAYQKASSSDKLEIIEIGKACVPVSEIPKLLAMYKDEGAASAMAYGRQYATPSAIAQIKAILAKYLD